MSLPLERHWLLSIASLVIAVCGVVSGVASAQSNSGQTHIIQEREVFCETKFQNDALVVVCQSGGQDHLVIVQVADGLTAFPLTPFGRVVNQTAYRYMVADANGAQNAEQLLALLGL